MLLPLYDPISLCMLQASAGISQGLGAKIKSCELTDQSSTTGMHHLSSFVLLTLVTSAWASIFFVLHRLLQLVCNPHDTAGSRDAPHLPSFLSYVLRSHFSEQRIGWAEEEEISRWQSAPLLPAAPSLSSVPPPLSPQPKDPAHPIHIHPLNITLQVNIRPFFVSAVPGTPQVESSGYEHTGTKQLV